MAPAAEPPGARAPTGLEPGSQTSPPRARTLHEWLFARYWLFSLGILLWSLPLVAWAGGRPDVLAAAAYGAVTLVGWLASRVARRASGAAVRVHLAAVIVFWATYAAHPGGLPAAIDESAAGHVVMMMLPILVAVAVDGYVGAAWAGGLVLATLVGRYGLRRDTVVGGFLVGSSVLIGLAFRRQTLRLEHANARLTRIATHDPVTDLPNRRALDGHLARVKAERGALFSVDLARFKTVNDVFGHTTGDALLRMVGERLQAELREAGWRKPEPTRGRAQEGAGADRRAFFAHLGGDEFAAIVEGVDEAEAKALAAKLLAAVERPFEADGHALHVGCRVGVATWPHDGAGVRTLYARADRAAARARRSVDRVALYDAALDGELDRGVEVELWRAIEQGEIVPWYQPVCDLGTGAMVGVEALARWQHKERGLLGPATFVELAELTGQIVQIDRLMLQQVARQLDAWADDGVELWAAANVSARTLDDPTFLPFVRGLVEERPGIRGRLVLEITESAAMRAPERAAALLHEVRELGVRTALDDFGVGHSSLVYLKRLPADHLKLDRMFIAGIGASDQDEALLELLLHLARQFGMHVIAEGIETPAQLRWLTDRGCQFAQGFLFARPAPASEVRGLRGKVSGFFARPPEAGDGAGDGEAPRPDVEDEVEAGDKRELARVGSRS